MRRVEPAGWKAAVVEAMAEGFVTPVALMGLQVETLEVRVHLRAADGTGVTLATSGDAGVPTLIDVLPDLAWDEREAAEMFGIDFTGHDTQPLLLAPGAPIAPMRKEHLLDARHDVIWPGIKEPGEDGSRPVTRRRTLPVGVDPERMPR